MPPAIVALYFLKLSVSRWKCPARICGRSRSRTCTSTACGNGCGRTCFCFLQLLLVALAMLALLRPGWESSKLDGERFIFLVDNSASMSATDVDGAKNRLDEAKKLVGGLIDQMDSGMTAMLVSFADTPQVVQEFTNNRRLLRERLETIEPTVRGTDLKGALELADGLANPSRMPIQEGDSEIDVVEAQPATVYIFSDGRFEDVKGFSLGNLKPYYIPLGSLAGQQLGDHGVHHAPQRRPSRRTASVRASFQFYGQTARSRSSNCNSTAASSTPRNRHAGRRIGRRCVSAGRTRRAGKLTARFKYELDTSTKQDALEQDDIGYAALNDAKPGHVLVVSPGNIALEVALATERAGKLANIEFKKPDVLTTDQYKRDADAGTYDLIIYDQCAPAAPPRANTLFIGQLPPGTAWRGGNKPTTDDKTKAADDACQSERAPTDEPPPRASGPQIIDWDRSHPILSNVELGNVDIADSIVLQPPPGATVLIDSTAGPIAAVAPRDAYQDAVLGFEIFGTRRLTAREP